MKHSFKAALTAVAIAGGLTLASPATAHAGPDHKRPVAAPPGSPQAGSHQATASPAPRGRGPTISATAVVKAITS